MVRCLFPLALCASVGALRMGSLRSAKRSGTQRASAAAEARTMSAAEARDMRFESPRVVAVVAPAERSSAVSPPEAQELSLGAWLPVASKAALRGLGPQSVEVCGRSFVVWEHEGEWSVLGDACPHRLAPLSQGRVDAVSGCIECPYHGWQFDAEGRATSVPQNPEAPLEKLSAQRIPTRATGDLLWGFFGNEITGERSSSAVSPEELYPGLLTAKESEVVYFSRELPYSWDMLLENFMDPSHIPFAHHGLQGVRADGSPIPMKLLVSNETHIELSFEDVVRGAARGGVVSFQRPARYHFRTKDADGEMKERLVIYTAPVSAGRSRVFFSSPAPVKLPDWLSHAASNRFLNTDVWLHDAERTLREAGGGHPDAEKRFYAYCASADKATIEFRKWWRTYGMAASPASSFGPASFEDLSRQTRAEMIDPWRNHARQCASCRDALKTAGKVETGGLALAAAALLLLPGGSLQRAASRVTLCALGGGAAFGARRVKAIIQGESQPAAVADRSVAALSDAGLTVDPPKPKRGIRMPGRR